MAACYHAMLTPYFKFMNVANDAWQSQQMFEMLIEQSQDTIFGKMIRAVQRPHYRIDIEYQMGKMIQRANLQFMSLGEKSDASNIFTWRGDWINIDEAWLINDLATVVTNLSTRLTGSAPGGRPFLGRMSMTSNPGDSPELWQYYDIARSDKDEGLIFNIDTRTNRNVTEKQVKNLIKMLTPDQQKRFLTGQRPEGRGTYFSPASIKASESETLASIAKTEIEKETPGWTMKSLPHLGVYEYVSPPKEGRVYMLAADPGIGAAPARNAPVVIVIDVTEAPSNSFIVGFWWGNGGNSISPFLQKLLEWIDFYKPMFAGVDNTGPQKSTAELINLEYITGQNKSIDGITGLDFSGVKRYSYLTALRLTLTAAALKWPTFLSGVSTQLRIYDPIIDRNPNSKLAQDIVATLAMVSFAIRAFYGSFTQESDNVEENPESEVRFTGRYPRSIQSGRFPRHPKVR